MNVIPRAENKKMPNPDPRRIKKITESIIGLPTLPTVVSKMIELVDNPRTSASSLARLISNDQALTARILKLANSAYYGYPREISTVNMAVVVLGFNTVKDMGLSLSVFDVFKNVENSLCFDISRFWEHSIACGIGSRMLAREYQSRFAGEAFVAGLLHDIGKVVLNQYFHDEFVSILKMAQDKNLNLQDAELEILGTTHAQVGAWLAEKWNLPKIIVDTILNHHTPNDSLHNQLFVSIITFSDFICHSIKIGNSGRPQLPLLDDSVWEIYQSSGVALDISDLDTYQNNLLIEMDRSEAFLSFIHNNEPTFEE